ncbi:MAG: hypothetical protein J6A94_04920 [Lachnospiraceae bacterium]|nr:hypothetical protein [Lachnospiraceae bacterium]
MKKILILMTTALLLGICTGCQKQEKEPEKLTVCVDYHFCDQARELIDVWEKLNEGAEAELVVIPKDSDTAEIKMTEIRTEIMSGGGPDVFILSCINPMSAQDEEAEAILFSNPEKMMYADVFLPLDEYMKQANYMRPENWNQTILEAGRTEEGQMLLPILYHYAAFAFHTTDVEGNGGIPSSWEELLVCENPVIQKAMSLTLYSKFSEIYGRLADYQEEKLLFTEEELLIRAQEAAQYIEATYESDAVENAPDKVVGGAALKVLYEYLAAEQEDYTIIGLPNEAGGVTANITMYAGINHNTKQPEMAFSLIDVFFSDEFMSGTGFRDGEHSFGQLKWYSWFEAPINRQAYQNMYSGLTQKDMDAIENLESKINAVRFYSNFDKELYNMFYLYVRTRDEDERKEMVHSTYNTLQMELSE